MGQDEAYRARGYVSFEGRWVTPPEHEALVRERAAEEASERETREAGLRVREAEARARRRKRGPGRPNPRRSRSTAASLYGWGWGGGGWGWGGGVVLPVAPWAPGTRPSGDAA